MVNKTETQALFLDLLTEAWRPSSASQVALLLLDDQYGKHEAIIQLLRGIVILFGESPIFYSLQGTSDRQTRRSQDR